MTQTYDDFYGRILAMTTASTDAYQEIEIVLPSVTSVTGKATKLYVPVVKEVNFHIVASNFQIISADAQVNAALMLGGASLYSGLPTLGVADPNCIAYWNWVLSLTTSGQVVAPMTATILLPGAGLIVTSTSLTAMMFNAATGASAALATRIWYDFVEMDEMTYMRSLHGMSV